MTSAPRPLPGILDIAPYKGGEAAPPYPGVSYKLASNENPMGCSPRAVEAYRAAAEDLAAYPDGAHKALKGAIAARHGIDPAWILCSAGSDEAFQLLGRAYLGRGDAIVQSQHAFLVYRLIAQQCGADVITVPDIDRVADVAGMAAAVTDRTRIVFLANPNNPTGTYVPFDAVRALHAALPPDVLLVLDGAYAEYVGRNDYSAGLELVLESRNVMMTRTFSKIHGLAALRVGWAVAHPDIIAALDRVRGPFNVSGPGLAAAAAAFADEAFEAESVRFNAAERERLAAGLAALGLKVTPSVGNFVLTDFGDPARADAADAALKANGLSVRKVASYDLPGCLRISIGPASATDRVLTVLADFCATA